MKRYLEQQIINDLSRKIVLLMGPRQSGKTTLAKQLSSRYDYFNYDADEDRLALKEKSWDREKPLLLFDELHKMPQWKRWLKGIYDTEGIPPNILVTGSARLDIHQNVGDSLAGRYFQYRLHPLDLKEICNHFNSDPEVNFARLWDCSGFPEPFIEGDSNYYKRWRRSHLEIILRQDFLDLHTVRDIKAIETLVLLLKQRIGSSVSYANLARDLERDPQTIKHWLQILENLYVIFPVTPYHKNIARALLKEPKYYFYDHTHAENGDGAKLENIVACALLKEIHYCEDTTGIKGRLYYLRTKDGKELDFLVCFDNMPVLIIEVKLSDANTAAGFRHFSQYFPNVQKLQLVKDIKREKTFENGLAVRALIPWLKDISLSEYMITK